ncbi:hypothetical protein E4T50_07881 [Aureobasidium sp. EXF-12298]|nr:hypothetical protein E4T50_07881 [Aureobasidium sp. EXF-12298]
MSSKPRVKSIPDSQGQADIEKKTSHASQSTDEHPPLPFSGSHEACFIFIICLSQFLALGGLPQSIAPLQIIALSKESILALTVIAAGWGSFGVWVYYLWNFIEVIRGYSALAACAQNAPVAISGLLASVATGILLSKTKVSNVLLLATLFFLIGQILIATTPIDQVYWAQTFVAIIIMPWGMDLSFPSGTIILSN